MKRVWLILFAWLLFSAQSGLAADVAVLTEAQEARVQAIDGQVLSPFCPGRLLQDCPSTAAKDLRDNIRARIAAGASDEEILDSIYATYGEEFRAAPSAQGVGLLAWLAPGLFLLIGGAVLFLWISSRWSSSDEEPASEPTPLDPELEEVVEQELRRI